MASSKSTKRRTLDEVTRFTTSLGEGTRFTGTFSGGENYVIQGSVTGDSTMDGAVVIAETGEWIGTINARLVVVAGRVEGAINAREKLEILATARVKGNLQSPVVAIAAGAIHEGELRMGEPGQKTEFDEKRHSPFGPSSSE